MLRRYKVGFKNGTTIKGFIFLNKKNVNILRERLEESYIQNYDGYITLGKKTIKLIETTYIKL